MDIRDKSITAVGPSNGHVVSLPTAWMKAKMHPSHISMVVGNLLIVVPIDEKELGIRAANCLTEANIMEELIIEGMMEEVLR